MVLAGLVVLGLLSWLALALMWKNADKLPSVIGSITSPIVAIVSAYLGLRIGNEQGLAGTTAANESRERAEKNVTAILADLPPGQAAKYTRMMGAPTAPSNEAPWAVPVAPPQTGASDQQ
ncbi:hypothetical protein AQI95_41065 [Streptomyces yokosukanensis]|uniref:Uncharacterized protein n=1 Tax=Streptomyces yokosukanensis TaxID=67386 RepID=A0A101NTD6_9ACTN|nr:hypothetical protein [Streptomyces yokosukanensis]KUM98747.1 hypothetical protein AQI95_41065 [Streptomyces yokosukanensis]